MNDEVLDLIRKNLVDVALDNRDWEAFKRLTSSEWQEYVVFSSYSSPFDFLCNDPHFIERRVIDDGRSAALFNYRYQDGIIGQTYIGEIRIPVHGTGNVSSKYRLRHKQPTDGEVLNPDWFCSLVNRASHMLELLHKGE